MSYLGNTPEVAELKRLADAIEQSAKGAEQAALAAKRSAFWTMNAAIVSLVGIVVAAATTLGWLDWARKPIIQILNISISGKVHINSLGILLATVGAFLVWRYLTELNWANKGAFLRGEGIFEIPSPKPEDIKKFKHQIFLSKVGVWFIFAGGILQIISNYLSG